MIAYSKQQTELILQRYFWVSLIKGKVMIVSLVSYQLAAPINNEYIKNIEEIKLECI